MEPTNETKAKSPWPTLISLALVFAGVAWLVLIGHHRHRLTFVVNGKSVTLISRKSPWVVERPDAPAAPVTYYGLSLLTSLHGTGTARVVDGYPSPEYCSGFGVLHREQKVELFDVGEVRLEFTINSRPFVLTTTELKGGDRTWPLTHAPTEVDVDALQ